MLVFPAAMLISLCAFISQANSSPYDSGGLMLKIGFVSDSGLVMFYTGPDSGLEPGDSYTVYSETGKLAAIRIERIERNFTSAKITSGSISAEYTGKNAILFSNSPAPVKQKAGPEITEAPPTEIEPDVIPEKKNSDEDAASAGGDETFSQPPATSNSAQQAKNATGGRGPVYSMLVRFDSHSSGDYPDANIATVISATRRGKDSFTTLYVLNNTDISNRIPDYFGFGLNYSQYLSPIWNYSLGYNYQARDDVNYIPDFKTRIDTVNAGLYRTVIPKTMKNSVFTGWGAFSTRANFRESRSYSGNLSYIQKLKDNMRFSLSFRRLWLFGADGYKHSSDQYGTDFSFMFRDKKITLGYFYLDREYFSGPTTQDDDRNFRFTVYSSGK